MELAFSNRNIRKCCENERFAKKQFGDKVAGLLKARISDLYAATNITDLIAGRLHVIDNTVPHRMALEFADGKRLVFCANHVEVPKSPSGGVDWLKVSRIKLLEVEHAANENQ